MSGVVDIMEIFALAARRAQRKVSVLVSAVRAMRVAVYRAEIPAKY